MKKPLCSLLIITLLFVFTGCKKDEPVAFYPKTFTQRQITYAYEFKVHDKTISPPPPMDSFYSGEYLNNEFSVVSFTFLNNDTLQLNWSDRSLDRAYILRNDTLYLEQHGPSQGFGSAEVHWIPFAYGNKTQFTMVKTHFSNTQVSMQNTLHNWPFEVQAGFSYKDYSFFTDTAALLTITRILK